MPIRKQKKFGIFFKRTESEKQISKLSKNYEDTQNSLEEAMEMIRRLSEEIETLKGKEENQEESQGESQR